jgi:molybdate transport system substrate-binding protein
MESIISRVNGLRCGCLLLALAMLVALPGSGQAADVTVLTAGAFKQVVLAVVPLFEQRTGDRLIVKNDTAGALQKQIIGGTPFDVTILPPSAIDALITQGKLQAATKHPLARTGIGVVVRKGAPIPDISTVAALRQALLSAPSIAYIDPSSGGSSGAVVQRMIRELGIEDQVRSKTHLIKGGLVAQHVADGEADLGIHQISEILAVPEVALVGPLPDALQSYTVYVAAISTGTEHDNAAQTLVDLLTSADGAAAIRKSGMEPLP